MRPGFRLVIAAAIACAVPASSPAAVRLRTRTIEKSSLGASIPADATRRTVVVAARGRVSAEWKAAIVAAGAELVVYLPDDAFLARIEGRAVSRLAAVPGTAFVEPLLPGDKVAPEMAEALDAHGEAGLPVHVLVAPDVAAAAVAASAKALGLAVYGAADGGPYNDVSVHVPAGRLDLAEALSRLEPVLWIEPRARRVLLNDTSMWVTQSGLSGSLATPIWDHGILGKGQTVAVLDTGLDFDMCYFRDPSGPPPVNVSGGTAFDPNQRKVVAYDMLFSGDDPANPADYDNHGHGTHVSGTVAGDDDARLLVHDLGDGMAPAAKLVMQDGGYTGGDNCADLPGIGCPVVDLTPMFDQAYQQGARIHSNSWGDRENFNPQNTYTAACVDTDDFMYTHPDFLLVYAAGNSGPNNDTVGSPSVAKDTLSVAATNRGGDAETLANFSSRGYSADRRFKPTIAAPGVTITSADGDRNVTTGNCGDTAFSGTSMACPTAAGLSALVRQYYMDGFYPSGAANGPDGFAPSAALVKATIVNSGRSMTGQAPIPSRDQGFGRITLADTLRFKGDLRQLFVVDEPNGFPTGSTAPKTFDVLVIDPGAPLKVTLVWTDPPSTPAAAQNLINDLDLTVRGPAGTFLGNVFTNGVSTTGGSPDRLNVEEEVLIPAPAPGTYTITIAPFTVPSGPQPYALVATGDFGLQPVDVAFEAYTIPSDVNGNLWPDPNERARLAVSIRNVSGTPATVVSGRLLSLSPHLVVTDETSDFPDVAPGSVATTLPDHFEVLVSPDAVCGERIPMRLVVVASGQPYDLRFDVRIGGYAPVLSDDFDGVPAGQLPAPWTLATDRPGVGTAVADTSVLPNGSPGPLSPPNALYIGKTGNDRTRTFSQASRPLDLAPYVGLDPLLSFRWWAYEPESNDRLVVSLSDTGGASYPYTVFWDSGFDSATNGGSLWGTKTIDLAALPGFQVGAQDAVTFDVSVDRGEGNGDGFYLDDVVVSAITCAPVPCTEAVADTTGSGPLRLCTLGNVTLDGSRSTSPGCPALEYAWYQGTTLLGTTPVVTVAPTVTTTYRLEVRCGNPLSCSGVATVDVLVGSSTGSSVAANTLLGVRRGGSAELTWQGTGQGFNVHATTAKTLIPGLISTTPLNPAPVPTPTFTDPTPASPNLYYQAFGTNCSGQSIP